MLRRITAGTALIGTLTMIAPAVASPKPAPEPDTKLVINVASAHGSGCPDGHADVQVVPDSTTTFTVGYSQYNTASVGPDSMPLDFRKNCQLALDIEMPRGFTFAVAGAEYRGYASLKPGAYGEHAAGYYFAGHAQTGRNRHDLKGPLEGSWGYTDTLGSAALSYLPCGEQRPLNITTELRVNAGSSDPQEHTSFLSMDSSGPSINATYRIKWKSCE